MTGHDLWPTATIDRIGRLRALAAGLRGAHLHEEVLDASFDDVWRFVSHLEHAVPLFDNDVRSLRVLHRDGERLRIRARLPLWAATAPIEFDVTLHAGWCWMVSRPQLYVVGMAAEPDGSHTRFAHLEGVALPAARWARAPVRAVHALSRWRHRMHVPHDVEAIARHLRDADSEL